ncbi:MAG: hypothetical protein HYZ81_04195, partial [Nitrospinae bacterium]|nr:hypothetical protein [Nitrospinota bacterium]
MKTAVKAVSLLILIWFLAMPASGGELRVTGFIDNAIHVEGNTSDLDRDLTRNGDNVTVGDTRGQFFFNFIASDDLRGIFAMELDAAWGAPARNRLGSQCITAEQCGFRNAIDVNNFELKQLYVDFRIPQLPIGNRWRVG